MQYLALEDAACAMIATILEQTHKHLDDYNYDQTSPIQQENAELRWEVGYVKSRFKEVIRNSDTSSESLMRICLVWTRTLTTTLDGADMTEHFTVSLVYVVLPHHGVLLLRLPYVLPFLLSAMVSPLNACVTDYDLLIKLHGRINHS
ncbi:hypothetical protein PIB30_007452 [Stylosanthes scabra]|uniref:Uncharacterized protein n=1 Tax=Stylosanthes scabra TaxID=79078 RepID=A0ABU6R5R0_9FABA|nr:hypothetical protein [Stylosanthes scabra]